MMLEHVGQEGGDELEKQVCKMEKEKKIFFTLTMTCWVVESLILELLADAILEEMASNVPPNNPPNSLTAAHEVSGLKVEKPQQFKVFSTSFRVASDLFHPTSSR